MEPPLKRQRLGVSQEQLLHKRARNDLRLKSRFESIFEKFSKDFTGVGDEIDLETGKVVVNNGHLTTMQGELDAEGLANEEDELATDAPVKHGSSQQSGLNGALLMNSQEDEDNSVQRVHEGPYGPEVACIGSSIAAALKMEDGSSYDSSVHGELFIPKNVLSQLSRLGPHIRKSIANVQRSSHTSKVVSIETEDLTVDPVWRVPVLVHPKLSTPSEEPHENEQCVPEEPPLASPERSPSPAGQSLWSLERPSDRSSPYENTGTKDFIKNQISQRKGRRPPRWTADEDAMLRKLKSTTKLTYQELETQFPDRTGKALEQRWHGMKMNIVDDSHITSAKSSSPCASLPRITELGLPGPVIESKSTTVNMQTSPATNTSAEMTDSAVLLLSSHEDEGILEGRQRRAEHARRAYQKLTSENALKHNEIQDIDESQVNDPQVSSKDIEVAEECISTRRTKRGRRTKIRRPAMTKESPNDTTLTEASFEPSSSRTSRHMEALKDTSRLPKARRPKTTRTPGTPEVTASNYSTENPSITERPLETSLGDIESEKNKKHQAVHEPSSQDINTSTNSRNGRLEIRKTRFKEVSVIITRQDNREALASSTVLEPQSSKVQFHSTQRDSPTPVSIPPARRGRPRRTISATNSHIEPESSSTNREVQPEPLSEQHSLRQEHGCTSTSVTAHPQDREHKPSNSDISRNTLSSSPDLATISTQQSCGSPRVQSSSERLRTYISRTPGSKPVSGKRRVKPASTADSPSLTSMLGEFSDDELCNTPNTGKIAMVTTSPVTPIASAKARRCGLPGYKCNRTLCLTCN